MSMVKTKTFVQPLTERAILLRQSQRGRVLPTFRDQYSDTIFRGVDLHPNVRIPAPPPSM